MKKPYWYLQKTKTGNEFYFTLRAPNGETILTSEMYESKQAAKNGIKSIRANAMGEIKDITN